MVIEINTLKTSPIYEQLRDQVVLGIAGKKLASGEALPSVRRLAADLGINLHTVNKAYAMLSEEGYIAMDRHKGAYVTQAPAGGGPYAAALAGKLTLAAAEAVCHNMIENDFISLCKECYKSAVGGS